MSTLNIDPAEIAKFEELASRWWDTHGEFKPLHEINPLRLHYIDERVNLQGKKVQDSMDLLINNGWNLVGIYNESVQTYQGFDVLNQMNTQSIQADVLSKWEDGQYYNLVSNEGVEYGNDYKVFPTSGYWIRSNSTEQLKYTPQ